MTGLCGSWTDVGRGSTRQVESCVPGSGSFGALGQQPTVERVRLGLACVGRRVRRPDFDSKALVAGNVVEDLADSHLAIDSRGLRRRCGAGVDHESAHGAEATA